MIFFQPFLISLIGCSKDTSQHDELQPDEVIDTPSENPTNEPIPVVGILPVSGDKEIWVETLFEEATIPYRLGGTRMLFHTNGEALFFDEAKNTTTSLGHFDQIEGVQLDVQQSMIILDGSRSLKEFGSQPQMNTRAINRYKATLQWLIKLSSN